ncbi:hypothetical protein MYU51_013959 [Penicillium brevicompactum]
MTLLPIPPPQQPSHGCRSRCVQSATRSSQLPANRVTTLSPASFHSLSASSHNTHPTDIADEVQQWKCWYIAAVNSASQEQSSPLGLAGPQAHGPTINLFWAGFGYGPPTRSPACQSESSKTQCHVSVDLPRDIMWQVALDLAAHIAVAALSASAHWTGSSILHRLWAVPWTGWYTSSCPGRQGVGFTDLNPARQIPPAQLFISRSPNYCTTHFALGLKVGGRIGFRTLQVENSPTSSGPAVVEAPDARFPLMPPTTAELTCVTTWGHVVG